VKLSLELFSKPIEPFQYPYYKIYWNGSCYLEDTIECKTVDIDVDVEQGWNSFIFEVIDVFDVFDPLDNSLVAQTDYNIIDLKINGSNSWPVKRSNHKIFSQITFHSDHAVWISDRTSEAIIQGKDKDNFNGKGFTEICFYIEGDQITDHYYAKRNNIKFFNYLNLENIKLDSFSKNLLGLSNLRLKDQYVILDKDASTYSEHWGGLEFEIKDTCEFKSNLPQWVSSRPWPFRWIHAQHYGKNLPIDLAREFFNG
jgi:hypothetical protein